jgi:hypothetical protein
VSNEIAPPLGEPADQPGGSPSGGAWAGRNVILETHLMRAQLLEPPRRRNTALIVGVLVLAIALVAAGFAFFATLA